MPARAASDELFDGQIAQRLAEILGGGEDELADRQSGLRARLDPVDPAADGR
jgi:hypothetical protein